MSLPRSSFGAGAGGNWPDPDGAVPHKSATVEYRRAMAEHLIALADAYDKVATIVQEATADAPGRAASVLGSREANETGYAEVLSASIGVSHHLWALAEVLRLDYALGPPMFTLARACIEALGRGWFVLSAEDAQDIDRRGWQLRRHELQTAHAQVTIRLGRGRDAVQRPDALASLEAERPENTPVLDRKTLGYSTLAKAVMTAGGTRNPDAVYSLLSASAHAESTGIYGMWVHDPEYDAEYSTIGFSMEHAHLLTRTLTRCVFVVIDQLVDDWAFEQLAAYWRRERAALVSSIEDLTDEL